MAMEASGSLSCFAPFLSPPIKCRQSCLISLRRRSFVTQQNRKHLTSTKAAKLWTCRFGKLKSTEELRRRNCFPVVSEDFLPEDVIELSGSGTEELPLDLDGNVGDEGVSPTVSYEHSGGSGGKPGFVSFYSLQRAKENVVPSPREKKNQNSLLWFAGPAVLVASFILPSLYLRRIISLIFEDSLLTGDKEQQLLISANMLRFPHTFFHRGSLLLRGCSFLLLIHSLWSPGNKVPATSNYGKLTTQMGHRISSVAILMLSLIIPMVTMGFVWPWTGPAASAALAPYLVGIVVQFAFEQYAKYTKSPSWLVIPVVFQVYRLHQLNRATQLVTALSFTVRGAEMTAHNLAINNSLGTLLSVLQILGLICIWSLSNFLMRFFPSSILEQ
ncbi:uncharacterized protein LOC110700855 [Chenopodium quinoa]|uniref:uncharacterized protein LOC110700855 n=1 Tax=Chenopodium quinoa TaxID=63459 RepID=UPI000B76CE8E|nr:uncharacterized protein LOC110700855 [Chenopodium quinoa]